MKKIKFIGLIIVIILVCYGLLLLIEIQRFNSGTMIKPLIQVGATNVNITAGSDHTEEKIDGLGYSFEFIYISERKDNSDVQLNHMISGKFKLFNRFIISEWIS